MPTCAFCGDTRDVACGTRVNLSAAYCKSINTTVYQWCIPGRYGKELVLIHNRAYVCGVCVGPRFQHFKQGSRAASNIANALPAPVGTSINPARKTWIQTGEIPIGDALMEFMAPRNLGFCTSVERKFPFAERGLVMTIHPPTSTLAQPGTKWSREGGVHVCHPCCQEKVYTLLVLADDRSRFFLASTYTINLEASAPDILAALTPDSVLVSFTIHCRGTTDQCRGACGGFLRPHAGVDGCHCQGQEQLSAKELAAHQQCHWQCKVQVLYQNVNVGVLSQFVANPVCHPNKAVGPHCGLAQDEGVLVDGLRAVGKTATGVVNGELGIAHRATSMLA
jgi:hypothetical protein